MKMLKVGASDTLQRRSSLRPHRERHRTSEPDADRGRRAQAGMRAPAKGKEGLP